MQRPARLALLCLSLLLVSFPLVLSKPGWPAGLKADEPAYLLMALSLAHDGDLVADPGDLRRLVDEFPFHPTRNLILMTDDGWQTVYFGKPYIYSLFAAPFAWLAGASGLVAFNMALLLAMVWMGFRYLRRFNPEGVAALFSAGFFLGSVGFAYVFWLHPEVFNMAAVMASLHLVAALDLAVPRGDAGSEDGAAGRPSGAAETAAGGDPEEPMAPAAVPRVMLRALLSGAVLALAVYNKPMLALLAAAPLFVLLRGRRWGATAAWVGGAIGASALIAGLALALTGHPTSYLGVTRGGYTVCSPDVLPVQAAPTAAARGEAAPASSVATTAPSAAGAPGGGATSAPVAALTAAEADRQAAVARGEERKQGAASWSWLLRIPDLHPREIAERLGYFLWGRHTGLFLYQPFALLALLLFVVHGWRSGARWVLLASLAALALVFLLWIPANWHGGGGFVGNRYYIYAYPGFLYLVTRIAPAAVTAVGYLAAGLFLGPILFTPLGRAVPWPTLQAHVRNLPLRLFPLELSLKGVPGYDEATLGGVRILGRNDAMLPRGNALWLHGATTAELHLQSPEPLGDLLFQVASPAIPNEIQLELGDARAVLRFSADQPGPHRVVLTPSEATRTRWVGGAPIYVYRLLVRSRTGAVRLWQQEYPPRDCFTFPWVASSEEAFYVGAELTLLGDPERLTRDVYEIEWLGARAPASVAAGSTFAVEMGIANRSAATWPASRPAAVELSYHWLDPAGGTVLWDGLRTHLPFEVPPGGEVRLSQTVRAPERPGLLVLALDPVFEGVAWFSERNGGKLLRLPVEVTAAGTPAASEPAAPGAAATTP